MGLIGYNNGFLFPFSLSYRSFLSLFSFPSSPLAIALLDSNIDTGRSLKPMRQDGTKMYILRMGVSLYIESRTWERGLGLEGVMGERFRRCTLYAVRCADNVANTQVQEIRSGFRFSLLCIVLFCF